MSKSKKKGCGSVIGACIIIVLGIGVFGAILGNDDTSTINTGTVVSSNSVINSDTDDSSANNSDNPWATVFTPINDFRYTLNEEEKTITLERYIGDDTKILLSPIYNIDGIDYNLVSMGDSACFLSETHITSVYIPEGVTYIGSSCFNSCSSLEHLYIPTTASIKNGFLNYMDEYTLHYNSVIDITSSRDTTNYEKADNSIDRAEEAGEDVARALNGMMGGLDTPVTVNIYYGGTEEQWSCITE